MSRPADESDELKVIATDFAAILDAAVDGIVVIAEDGAIELVNAATEKIFGYQAHELIGQNVSCLMPEPDKSRHDNYLSNFLHTKSPRIIGIGRDVLGLKKSGDTFPLHLSVGEAKSGGKVRFVGLLRDLSERQQLVNRLSTTEEEFRLVFDYAPIGVLVCDQRAQISRANPWICEFLGYTQEEMAGRSIYSFIQTLDTETLKNAYARLINRLDPKIEIEISLSGKKNDPRSVRVHASALVQTNVSESVVLLITDRSSELANQIIAMEARDKLAHSDRLHSLGEMASAIAHEINQPLTAISAYAQASSRILEQPFPLENVGETLTKISSQAHRAGEIIRRIRSFSAKGLNEKTSEDLNDLLVSAIGFTQFSLDAAGITLSCKLSPELPKVTVDRLQIQQVCVNLIRNAVDAMSATGDGHNELSISSLLESDSVELYFVDQGCGVPKALERRLFEPFQSNKQDGLGLGLAISHKIISEHNGKLEYRPGEKVGSVFSISLPVKTV